MYQRLSQAAHRGDGKDAGLGLIMVIGMTGVITVIIGVLLTTVVNSLQGSNRHDHFDLALTSAESGIDQALSRTQADYVLYGATYLSPNTSSTFDSSPSCSASPVAWTGPFNTPNDERNWAIGQIKAMVAAHPNCLQHSQSGDFATFAPSGVQAVYSMGWGPSITTKNARTRLIKAEYLFVPYAPNNAVLTGGNLEVDSSTAVNTPAGIDPCLAQVHSNGTVSIGGNPTITGQISSTNPSSGSYKKGGCSDPTRNTGAVTTTPAQDIPVINAREVYPKTPADQAKYASSWYDLCPDGSVRQLSAGGPCTGTVLATSAVTSGGYRGWDFTTSNYSADPGAALWTGSKDGIADGIYFVYAGDVAQDNANPSTNSATIIAASTTGSVGTCPKIGGNIDWGKNNIGAPAYPGLFMLADGDLSTNSNFYAGSASSPGLFIAGDQVDLETSSNGAYGGVIAADQCNTTHRTSGDIPSDVVKNPTVTYVPNAQAPFTSTIDTSLWLEYPGSQTS